MPGGPRRQLPAGWRPVRRGGQVYLQAQIQGQWVDVRGPYRQVGKALDWFERNIAHGPLPRREGRVPREKRQSGDGHSVPRLSRGEADEAEQERE